MRLVPLLMLCVVATEVVTDISAKLPWGTDQKPPVVAPDLYAIGVMQELKFIQFGNCKIYNDCSQEARELAEGDDW